MRCRSNSNDALSVRKKVNEEVVVQMLVKATKNRLEKRGEIYLDSEEDFRDEKNLGVVITKVGAAKFQGGDLPKRKQIFPQDLRRFYSRTRGRRFVRL